MTGARVALVTEATEPGGVETSLRNLAAALAPELEVVVVGVDAQVAGWVAGARPGAATALLPAGRSRRDLAALLRQRAVLRGLDADVVHLNLSWAGACLLPTAAAHSLRGVPVVAVEHLSLPVGSARARRVKRALSRPLAAHVGVSEQSAREAERDNGLPPGSLRVVHNGVPDLGLLPRRRSAGRRVGTLARFHGQKGLDVLLHALALLPGTSAVLVGGGEDEAALGRQRDALGLADRVELRGWTPDPRAVLAELDVFVLPSRYEGFPLSVVEAMLAGVAVVATRVGGVPEAVQDGVTGHLVDPDDVQGLARALATALDDPGRTTAAARRAALRSFTDEAMARGFEQVYADVLGRPVGRAVPAGSAAAGVSRR